MTRSQLASITRSWLLLLLPLPGTISADQTITITLTPRNYVDPRLDDDFVCGISHSLDKGRLIAELNTNFIFEFLDQGKPSNPYYKTNIFDVLIFTMDGNPTNIRGKWLDEEKGPGLYSLMVVPSKLQCNSELFNDAKEAGHGYYPVYVTSRFEGLQEGIKRFKLEADNMKASYGGILPKLCGSKVAMENETAVSREDTLISLFNFLFNEKQRLMESESWKACKTAKETNNAFVQSNFFETEFEASFEKETERIQESAGSALSTIVKGIANNKKALCYIETEFNQGGGNIDPASEEDIVPYTGPIVFLENTKTFQHFLDIKKDNLTEADEYFKLHLKSMNDLNSNRKKRATYKTKQLVVYGKPTFHCDKNTPCLHSHQKCLEEKCVECVESVDCQDPSLPFALPPVCNKKVNICSKCFEGEGCPDVNNAKCLENNLELTVGTECVPCFSHGDCRMNIDMNDLKACNQGQCVECTTDTHCAKMNERYHGCNKDENRCNSVRPLTKILDLTSKEVIPEDRKMHTRMTWMQNYAVACYKHIFPIDWNKHANAEVGYVAYDNSKNPMRDDQFDTKFSPNIDLKRRCSEFSANVKNDKSLPMHAERQLLRKAAETVEADPSIDTIYIFSRMSPCNTCKRETMQFAYKDNLGIKLNVGWSVWYKLTDKDMKTWCDNVVKAKKEFKDSMAFGGVTLNYYPIKDGVKSDVISGDC